MTTEDEQLEELEEEAKALGIDLDKLDSDYGSPKPEKKENIFKFFKWLLQFKDSWKVGNLKDSEIGQSKLTIRGNLELAQYSRAEGLTIVADYFTGRADIIAATSMGRKGFMATLSQTTIKREQKMKEPSEKKKGFFSRSKEEETP